MSRWPRWTPPAWWFRLAAYLLVVGLATYSVWRIQQDDEIEEARTCVIAWERTDQIRDAIGIATLAGGEALIAVAQSNAGEVLVERYRQALNVEIERARAQIEDPPCNLSEAKERFD